MDQTSVCHVVRYTRRAQRVFGYAQQAAERAGQVYLAPEHLLLGLLRDPDNQACTTLRSLGAEPDDIRAAIEQRAGRADSCINAEVRLTPRANRVLALAHHEARRLSSDVVGTEHLLLGLIREREGLPGRILARAGVDLEAARSVLAKPEKSDASAVASVITARSKEIDALLDVLRRQGRLRRPSIGWGVSLFGVATLGPILLLAFALFVRDLIHGKYSPELVPGLVLLTFIVGILIFSVASRKQMEAARRLVKISDKRAIGYLLEIWSWPDPVLSREAGRAVVSLLPQLRTEDIPLLTPSQRLRLYSLLTEKNVDHYPEFIFIVLKAVERCGDSEALPYVRYLTVIKGESAERKKAREAARACLAALLERAERERSEQILVRPVPETTTAAPQAELLRPATDAADTSPTEFLRPSPPESGPAC